MIPVDTGGDEPTYKSYLFVYLMMRAVSSPVGDGPGCLRLDDTCIPTYISFVAPSFDEL